MSGTVNLSGKYFILNSIKKEITSLSGLYIGLYKTADSDSLAQLNDGIIEISGVGYSRLLSSTWNVIDNSTNPYLSGSPVNFSPSGDFLSDIKGYFVSKTLNGNDCFWSKDFPVKERGTLYSGFYIKLNPRYEIR